MSTDEEAYLTGKLLLAMPGIGDPRFSRAVIFICAHDENGAMGLAINNRAPGLNFEKLLDQLGITSDVTVPRTDLSVPVMEGGPVETARGFLLHSADFKQDDTITINDQLGVTGTTDALKALVGGDVPNSALFVLGYAGWTAGQLEQELQQNAWLVVEPDPALVFHEKEDEKWELGVSKLGFDPAMLSAQTGSA